MHPAIMGNLLHNAEENARKNGMTEEEIRKAEATLFVDAVIGIALMFLFVWLISPIVNKVPDFIEWTCSFNGTLDVEAYWEQFKTFIGVQNVKQATISRRCFQ